MIQTSGVDHVVLHVAAGSPAIMIADFADDMHADLVVVGDRGLRGLRGLFGSVASSVVRNANVPVLVVPTR